MHILGIKKTVEFQKIGKRGEKFFSKSLILLTAPTDKFYFKDSETGKNADDFCRFGVTVAKKVSKLAVHRNKAKRRLREAFKKLGPKYAQNHQDYVIIARKEILDADFKKIMSDLKFCISRIHNIKKSK